MDAVCMGGWMDTLSRGGGRMDTLSTGGWMDAQSRGE